MMYLLNKNIMEDKRKISILIPYKIKDGDILVYLQKRSDNAKRLPGLFGFFGGGREGNECPEEVLVREIKEEMDFIPKNFTHFKVYEFEKSIKDIFVIEADDTFENGVTILEGDYGRWFGENETLNEPKFIEEDKIVLEDFYNFLRLREKIE